VPPPRTIRSCPAQNLLPRGAALAGRDRNGARELEEPRRLGNHCARPLDAKQQLVPFVKLQRVP
jgi:hypothetical protein